MAMSARQKNWLARQKGKQTTAFRSKRSKVTRSGYKKKTKVTYAKKTVRQYLKDSQTNDFTSCIVKKYPTKYVKMAKKLTPSQLYSDTYPIQLGVPEGKQQAIQIPLANRTTLLNIFQNSGPFPDPLIGTNPITTYRNNRTGRILLESITAELTITNATSAAFLVDIYNISCKRDNIGAGVTFDDPITGWKYGVNDALNSGFPDVNQWTSISSRPTDSILFNKSFKVHKVTSMNLLGGVTHVHNFVVKPNKIIEQNLVNYSNAASYLKDYTFYIMVVARGQPVFVTDQAPQPNTKFSTAKGFIDCVSCNRYRYSYIDNASTYINTVDSIYSTAAIPNSVQKIVVEQDPETVNNVVSANL